MVDPFAPAEAGSFSASGVRVRRRVGSHRAHRHRHSVCTPRFCTRRHGGVLDVVHDLRPEELSDELAVLLAEELDDIGVLSLAAAVVWKDVKAHQQRVASQTVAG